METSWKTSKTEPTQKPSTVQNSNPPIETKPIEPIEQHLTQETQALGFEELEAENEAAMKMLGCVALALTTMFAAAITILIIKYIF